MESGVSLSVLKELNQGVPTVDIQMTQCHNSNETNESQL